MYALMDALASSSPGKSPNASLAHTYSPPSSGKREESSLMTNAPGTKKKNAASTHKLMDDVPLWPAAAIHRGPSTVAILKSKTSQKPIALRNCDFGSATAGAEMVKGSRPWRESICPASGNCEKTGPANFQIPPTKKKRWPGLPAKTRWCRPVFAPGGYHASPQSKFYEIFLSTAKSGRPCGRP